MNCVDVDGERLLIEWQMDISSNQSHYQQIETLINEADKHEKTTIVYGGLYLNEEMVSGLMKSLALSSEKNIRLVFLKINFDLLPKLIEINKMDEINRIKELDRLKEIEKIFIDKKEISICNSNSTVSAGLEDNNIIYSYEEKLLVSLIQRLRIDSWDTSTNVHQFKKVNDKGFTLGAGFEDITFRIFCNRKRTVGIKLVFGSKKTKELFYNLLKTKKEILDTEFNYILKWDERYQTIVSDYPISWFYCDREMMVNRLCREIKMYLIGFNNHLKEAIEERTH